MFGSKQTEAMRYKVANHNVGEVKKKPQQKTLIIWGTLFVLRKALTEFNTRGVFESS